MVTRLVRMAGAMKGGSELRPEAHDVVAQADELRQQAQSQLIGRTTWVAFEAYSAFHTRLGSTPIGTYRFRVTGKRKNDASELLTEKPRPRRDC